METIYINKPTITAQKEIVYKRKLIIYDDHSILAYRFRNMFRVLSVQNEEDLLNLTKEVTGFNLEEEDLTELIRVVSSYVIYNSHNYKLIPIIKEVVRDFYIYKTDLSNEQMDYIRQFGNDWYREPVRLNQRKILTSNTNTFNKLKIPVKYLWGK